jgi:hypothetical protein
MNRGSGQSFGGKKDYWGDALSGLETAKQERIRRALLGSQVFTSWPDIIAELCRREQDGHPEKERKLRFAGHDIDLRKMMQSWARFLERIKQVGDIAVNVDPVHAGLAWAAIRIILTVCSFGFNLTSTIADVLGSDASTLTGRDRVK